MVVGVVVVIVVGVAMLVAAVVVVAKHRPGRGVSRELQLGRGVISRNIRMLCGCYVYD